ncbi:MAG: N-acetylmuramoyl-L-alanine amidase [Thermodesulfobacteriota bacterium]
MTAGCIPSGATVFGIKNRGRDRGLYRDHACRSVGVMLLIFFILLFGHSQGNAEEIDLNALPKTVVLDPGHGGLDAGAKGPGGALEKTVCLNLARKIEANLKDHFRVILTRTDDYGLDLPDRTAVANRAGANLFVSLHTGAGFLLQQTGMSVFFFKEAPGTAPSAETEDSKPSDRSGGTAPWDSIQSRHLQSSQELARLLHQYLLNPDGSKHSGVQGAPLMVLRGADMPAVLVEPGYLTNPVEEKLLTDPASMARIAEKISNAIIVFLKK